jgi:hypothetical protein
VPELRDIAAVRSKNAEPFMTTCDIFVKEQEDYEWLKHSDLLTPNGVADLFQIPIEAVFGVFFVDHIRVAKVSIFKSWRGKFIASGDLEDLDVFGSQQHAPLVRLKIPSDRRNPADSRSIKRKD